MSVIFFKVFAKLPCSEALEPRRVARDRASGSSSEQWALPDFVSRTPACTRGRWRRKAGRFSTPPKAAGCHDWAFRVRAKVWQHLSKLQREAARDSSPRKWVGARRQDVPSASKSMPASPSSARRRAEVHQQSSEAEDLEHPGIAPEDEEDDPGREVGGGPARDRRIARGSKQS